VALKRSPILGYNHNFRHRGRVFHVQTEDSGVDNPHVFTHLFHGGVIINTRKLEYDPDSSEDAVKALMQAQHKAMLRDLKSTKFDDKIVAYLGPHPEGGESAERDEEEVAASAAEAAGALPLAGMPLPPDAPPPVAAPGPVLTEVPEHLAQVHVQFRRPGPAPAAGTPPPAGVGAYVQRGEHRREAPLAAADAEPPTAESPSAPVYHGDGSTQPLARGKRLGVSNPPPIPASRRRPTRPPPRTSQAQTRAFVSEAERGARQAARPPAGASVVVSRPSVIVGAPPRTIGGDDAKTHRADEPRVARARRAPSPSPPNSLFGRDLISEKSLDEVILAYLSEDAED
jgi:hypothetical protein